MPNRNFARVKAALDQLVQIELSLSALNAKKSKIEDYRSRAAGEAGSALSALNSLSDVRAALVRALVTYGNEYQAKDQTLAGQNGPYDGPLICYNFDSYLPSSPPADEKSYLEKTLRQIILGEFSDDDDFTALGMAGEVGLGLLGVDAPADIRDIIGSASKGDIGSAFFSALMLLPIVGAFKPAKHADDIIDGVHDIGKHADDILDGIEAGGKHADDILDGIEAGGKHADDILDGIEAGGKHTDDILDGLRKGDDILPGKPSDAMDFSDDFKHGDDMLENVPGKKPHKPYKPIYPKGPEIPRDLTEEYIEDLRSITEFPDDVKNIDPNGWRALDPKDNAIMRKRSNSATQDLKDEWSEIHKRPWPTYVDPETGEIKDYEMHHIHPLKFGGENVVENITPLSFEQHRKGGVHSVHRAGGPFSRMRTQFGHPNDGKK